MLIRKIMALLLVSVMLANCASVREGGRYCQGDAAGLCACGTIFAGLVVLGLVFGNGDDCSDPCYAGVGVGGGYVSDMRLKHDIHRVDTLPNGLQLYSFRYWNDDRTFVSVMAQDLLDDERFSHAVIEDESGYYKVNLAALGLEVAGSQEQFYEAGLKALAEAPPITN
nr:MAG: tail fiber domain-containing protein [Hyphomicrobiales bacterium]